MNPKNGEGFESPMLKGDKGNKGSAKGSVSGPLHSPADKTDKAEASGHKNGPKG